MEEVAEFDLNVCRTLESSVAIYPLEEQDLYITLLVERDVNILTESNMEV